MTRRTIMTVALVAMLAIGLAAPAAAAAAPGTDQVDECKNADNGSSDGGPPGFISDVTPDFLGDLLGGLPVPNFVKSAFGAETC